MPKLIRSELRRCPRLTGQEQVKKRWEQVQEVTKGSTGAAKRVVAFNVTQLALNARRLPSAKDTVKG